MTGGGRRSTLNSDREEVNLNSSSSSNRSLPTLPSKRLTEPPLLLPSTTNLLLLLLRPRLLPPFVNPPLPIPSGSLNRLPPTPTLLVLPPHPRLLPTRTEPVVASQDSPLPSTHPNLLTLPTSSLLLPPSTSPPTRSSLEQQQEEERTRSTSSFRPRGTRGRSQRNSRGGERLSQRSTTVWGSIWDWGWESCRRRGRLSGSSSRRSVEEQREEEEEASTINSTPTSPLAPALLLRLATRGRDLLRLRMDARRDQDEDLSTS